MSGDTVEGNRFLLACQIGYTGFLNHGMSHTLELNSAFDTVKKKSFLLTGSVETSKIMLQTD